MPDTHLALARRYLTAIEDGDAAVVLSLFTSDAVLEQLPNRIYPTGLRANVSQAQEAFARGRKLLSSQSYEITNAAETGNILALEVLWTGILAIPFGTLVAGDRMRCHSAMFFEFKGGKIATQRNYDCFEPW